MHGPLQSALPVLPHVRSARHRAVRGRTTLRTVLRSGAAALPLLVGACTLHHGPREDRIGSALPAAGVMLELRLQPGQDGNTQRLTGELLAVQDDGLLLLGDTLWLVAYDTVHSIEHEKHVFARRGTWRARPRQRAAELRPASRYPQGVPAEVLAHLLAALGQPDVLRVGGPEVEP